MSLLDAPMQEAEWLAFLEYRIPNASMKEQNMWKRFVNDGAYIPVCERLQRREPFPLPKRGEISKQGSDKRRTVYTYPYAENMVLKLLTYKLLRKYDYLFTPNLYSFRSGHGAKEALRYLVSRPGIGELYSYKVDISNYFNSVDLDLLLPELETTLADDPELAAFLTGLLREPQVRVGEKAVAEEKGLMAGTPQACFYANLFLREMDRYFYERRILYARYSDDIIVFAKTEEELREYVLLIREMLKKRHLQVNEKKEFFTAPGEQWTFLGYSYLNGNLDIAPASVIKIKQKMRRKARALERWRKRKGLAGDKAAVAFVRAFNRKLYENAGSEELTWSRWFFPVITTPDSLRVIDNYAEDCIRYLVTGTHTKARFNCTYEKIKALGFRSLVHEYYLYRGQDDS